jgi:hypothetical protein
VGHAERIIAEIATLNEVEQVSLLVFVARLKAARSAAKLPKLDAAQTRDRDALAAELSQVRISLAGYKFDREEANAR